MTGTISTLSIAVETIGTEISEILLSFCLYYFIIPPESNFNGLQTKSLNSETIMLESDVLEIPWFN